MKSLRDKILCENEILPRQDVQYNGAACGTFKMRSVASLPQFNIQHSKLLKVRGKASLLNTENCSRSEFAPAPD